MLTIHSHRASRDCQGGSRRDFLKVGALGATALTLPALLRAKAEAGRGGGFVRDKSIVFLFLAGGPSQYETFDPKMTAPAEIRSVTGQVSTSLPGVTFGGTFPELARRAHRMAIVRSFKVNNVEHCKAAIEMLTGGLVNPRGSSLDGEQGGSMGSIYARLRGTNHPQTGIPTNALLNAPEIDEFFINAFADCVRKGSGPGSLGAAYAPFDPNRARGALSNMQLNLPLERFEDRRQLLRELDRVTRVIEADERMAGHDRFVQQAYEVIAGDAAKALDLSAEDPRVVERYDTSHITIYGHKTKNSGPSTLGRQMLLARRLCEAGCGFVTVASSGWDMHGDINNPNIQRGFDMVGRPVDKAVSAFLDDVQDRGLSDKVLLIISGEFGREPRLTDTGGRAHWTEICPVAFAGGGLRMGQVIGQSRPNGDAPATEPILLQNLMATIMHQLFDISELRLARGIPNELAQLIEAGKPIEELI